MDEDRQKNQHELAFRTDGTGEARAEEAEGTRASVAAGEAESPRRSTQLMEEIARRSNIRRALERVLRNRGAAGVDGMRADQLRDHLNRHWPQIQKALLEGTYRPLPVRRVNIPKPDGGTRTLGIPTVMDRLVQQAILQVLQPQWDPTFSTHSYGFRPNRSQHDAIAAAQRYIAEGYEWVADLDLEKFFDRVNHDRLMSQLAKRIEDKRLLKLIRAFLEAGVMEGGLVSPLEQGTPQGGPLSPFLSNVVLDELDRELQARGHRFVRYADDCNIYVRSERAGQRVMATVTRFITKKLKLNVNETKSAVARPEERKFLGFTFRTIEGAVRRVISLRSIGRFREKVRGLTARTRGRSLSDVIQELNAYLRGWIGYYGVTEHSRQLETLDKWIRRRLRAYQWKQWTTIGQRYGELCQLGVTPRLAKAAAGSSKGAWTMSHVKAVDVALTKAFFTKAGLLALSAYEPSTSRTAVYGPVRTVV
ncbi:MAG: group II intron reverse transcriptase/maturase [Acidobacteria bacterium]|nr:group II intron reverse transcriptase/maturase [Acidobacteriota bacterium]